MYTYLLLNIFTISVPLLRSFEPRIDYMRKWPSLAIAIAITGAFFIIWDILFTKWGIWHFNQDYVIGQYFQGLPLEEWLFFLTVPFACVFIYEVLKYFVKKNPLKPISNYISWLLIAILSITAIAFSDRLYTTVTFSLSAILLLIHQLALKKDYLADFYLAFLVAMIPFGIVNGILTSWPVVLYNDAENLGIRLGTIPLEDTIYCLLLLLMNITIYEYCLDKIYVSNKKMQSIPTNKTVLRGELVE